MHRPLQNNAKACAEKLQRTRSVSNNVHRRQFILKVTGILLIIIPGLAQADHALLTDGRILFNVSIPEQSTTGTQLVQIRTNQMSFEFDPTNNIVTPLPKFSIIKRLADFVKTSDIVGREQARAIFQRRAWQTYQPPTKVALITPTPAPKVTPTPVNYTPPPPVALHVVNTDVPVQERLDRQLDIFMKEQSTMARDAVTSVVSGKITPARSIELKVGLLNQQKNILEQYYPQAVTTVKTAIDYWGKQIERTTKSGRFDLEDL